MFEGSVFCGHCGSKMVVAEVRSVADAGKCPRCRLPLEMLVIGKTSFRECRKCEGLWADAETFRHLCETKEEQTLVLGTVGEREIISQPMEKVSYVPCPDCKQLMNRNNFAQASGVIIDICKKHGVWFDAGEIQRVIGFIEKGGMEVARQREKMEIEEQRARLREEQRKLGIQNQTLDMNEEFDRYNSSGITGFLAKLFD
jgi:Zn-finger nucleic acid-binding protein